MQAEALVPQVGLSLFNYQGDKRSNKHKVYRVLFFLLGDSWAAEFYMPTFRNALSVPSSWLV